MRLEYRSGSEPSSSIYHRTEETSSNRVVRFPLHLFVLSHQLSQSALSILISLSLLTDKRLRVLKEGTNQPVWDIWAIGDASVIEGELLPATAQVAAQKSTVRPFPFLLSIPKSQLFVYSMMLPLPPSKQYLTKLLNRSSSAAPISDAPEFKFISRGNLAYLGDWNAIYDRTKAEGVHGKVTG